MAMVFSLIGLPWAVSQWAPHTLIGEHISGNTDSGTVDCGMVTAIHNSAISAPQVFAALIYGGIADLAGFTDMQGSAAFSLRVGAIPVIVGSMLALHWFERR